MQQLENDLDQTQEKLMAANQRLEEKEKALQNVSQRFFLIAKTIYFIFSFFSSLFLLYLPRASLSHTHTSSKWTLDAAAVCSLHWILWYLDNHNNNNNNNVRPRKR